MAASATRKIGRPRAFILATPRRPSARTSMNSGSTQHFGKNPVHAHHQSCGKRHEVTGDMREKKTLQAEKSGGVDEPGIETEQLEMTPSLHRPAPQISVQCKSRYSDGNPLALTAEPHGVLA